MHSKQVLGIDMGGTNLRFGLVDEKLELSNFTIYRTQEVMLGGDPILQITKQVRHYLNSFNGACLPRAISIGFPSTIDRSRRIVRSTPNIRGMDNLNVADFMEEKLGIPVFVNRDVNFLFLHDLNKQKLRGDLTVLGFYLGTGFGNAIMVNGQILLGKNGVAAELGHIPTYHGELRCGCGNIGCVETIASGLHLSKIQKNCFPETKIDDMFVEHGQSVELLDFIDALSLPIATEINIFDPDYIIMGGGLLQMKNFPSAYLEERIYCHSRKPYPADSLEILYSVPKQENGVLGAGIYGFTKLGIEERV